MRIKEYQKSIRGSKSTITSQNWWIIYLWCSNFEKLIIFYKMKEGKKVKPNEESEENEEDLSSYEEE